MLHDAIWKRGVLKIKKVCCIMVMLFLLLGCAKNNKDLPSEQFISYGNRLIEISDQYLDYHISAGEAHEMVESLNDRWLDSLAIAEPGTDDYFAESSLQNSTWNIELHLLSLDVQASAERREELIEERNKVADFIGVDRR